MSIINALHLYYCLNQTTFIKRIDLTISVLPQFSSLILCLKNVEADDECERIIVFAETTQRSDFLMI